MRKIAVIAMPLDVGHRSQLETTAAKYGFSVDYYADASLPDERLGDYEVVYGLPAPVSLGQMTALRWLNSGFAGVDNYVDESLYARPDVLLTNSSGAYGLTISEHILMVTLMLLRRYPFFDDLVRRRDWQRSVPMRSLYGSRITVLGTGNIGTTFAQKAKALGAAYICGVHRTDKPLDPCYDASVTFEHLADVLPTTEILVMALPGTPETNRMLSRELIALLPREAIVVNVGRGNSVDQEALMEALNDDRITAAALDVMEPEPLPKDHPLWETKHLLLTPHCSGNFSLGATLDTNVSQFCENLRRYTAGEPLAHLVDKKRGY